MFGCFFFCATHIFVLSLSASFENVRFARAMNCKRECVCVCARAKCTRETNTIKLKTNMNTECTTRTQNRFIAIIVEHNSKFFLSGKRQSIECVGCITYNLHGMHCLLLLLLPLVVCAPYSCTCTMHFQHTVHSSAKHYFARYLLKFTSVQRSFCNCIPMCSVQCAVCARCVKHASTRTFFSPNFRFFTAGIPISVSKKKSIPR